MDKEARLKALDGISKEAQARHAPIRVTSAYAQGFRKVAADAGLDPEELMKMAYSWGEFWDDTKTLGSAAVRLPGELAGQLVDGTTLKNLGTGAGRMLNGVGIGAAKLFTSIGGIGGALASGLTGNGWGTGWNAGVKAFENIGVGDWDVGHAKRRMSAWDNRMRDDYLDRNNIDLSHPDSLNWADKLALLGSDMAQVAGTALSDTAGGGALLGAAGKAISGAGRVGNVLGKGVEMLGGTGPIGPWGGMMWGGMTVNRALGEQGNQNRQVQDFSGSGRPNPQSQWGSGSQWGSQWSVNDPGDISDQITW